MSEWKTIESAPPGRVMLLLYAPTWRGNDCIRVGYFDSAANIGMWTYPRHDFESCKRHQPTHWMPLPVPPKVKD
jgi:hypothetical protein